ncbi:hypothetical protein RBH29_07230 [Herbivorax sp. ANBcel31]|nr:hypothetical protein [Herbivorax sp. ANBcel31]MDQ2086220.1 hypothetical protein [Herbivorax sp. ANBcel31]
MASLSVWEVYPVKTVGTHIQKESSTDAGLITMELTSLVPAPIVTKEFI